jgi:hypothetical protein
MRNGFSLLTLDRATALGRHIVWSASAESKMHVSSSIKLAVELFVVCHHDFL